MPVSTQTINHNVEYVKAINGVGEDKDAVDSPPSATNRLARELSDPLKPTDGHTPARY